MSEIEWLLLILVVLYLFFVNPALARSPGVLGVLLGFAAFVLVFRYARPFAAKTHIKLTIEILGMFAFLTAVLALAGGVSQPADQSVSVADRYRRARAQQTRDGARRRARLCGYPLLQVLTGGVERLTPDFAVTAIGVLAPFLLVAFCTTLLVENINTAKQRIRALSDRDELTGIYNMRAFTRLAEQEHEIARRTERPYSVLILPTSST